MVELVYCCMWAGIIFLVIVFSSPAVVKRPEPVKQKVSELSSGPWRQTSTQQVMKTSSRDNRQYRAMAANPYTRDKVLRVKKTDPPLAAVKRVPKSSSGFDSGGKKTSCPI